MLASKLDDILYVFVTLLALVNPISAAAAFGSLTEGRSAADQARIAQRAAFVAAVALILFAFVGEALLRALGVEIGAFKIAGGLLLLKVGFDMVFAERTDAQTADRARSCATPGVGDPAVFPLGIPIITGPGALTASVALVNPTPGTQLLNGAIFFVIALIVIGIVYASMLATQKLMTWFGETGVEAVSRIVGIIVAAIAVQLVVSGVAGLTNLKIR
jgi:multiple antibiotic resistance protein